MHMAPKDWTHDADERLRKVMLDCAGLSSWPDVVQLAFPDGSRGVEECVERWKLLSKPLQVKGPWGLDEDRQLVALVNELSTSKWGEISKRIGTRSGKQCRERWHNHLDPSIDKRPFTPAEDALILQLHSQLGGKWAEISRHLVGRPDNAIKNHFNTTLNRTAHRLRRESISSTTTTSTSRSSDSPGPPSTPGRRRLNGPLSETSAPTSPRFAPYGRPRAGTDVLLPSPIVVSRQVASLYEPGGSTMLTRSQSNTDIPSLRRRSVRTSLQMTPARSMDAPLHLKLTAEEMQPDGFIQSGPSTAPILGTYSSPVTRGSDLFDTWSTPPATPDALPSSQQRDYYFADRDSIRRGISLASSLPGLPSPSSSLQAALDDLILSPGSASTTRTASLMSRFGSSSGGSAPPSPQSPMLTRSMSYAGVPPSSLALYDAGITAHKLRSAMPPMLKMGSSGPPSMIADYGSSSSGYSVLSDALPLTPPQSAPSSCSTSSNSLSSYPFDPYSTDPISTMMSETDMITSISSRSSAPAHQHITHHSYALRSSARDARDTPSPAKSDLTV